MTAAAERAARPPRAWPDGGWLGLKRFLPRTLFGRTLLIIVTPVVLAQAVATWIFFDRHWESMTRRLASGVAGDIAMVVELLETYPSPDDRTDTLSLAARSTDLIISLEEGRSLPDPLPQPHGILQTMLANALKERVGRPFTIDTEIVEDWYEIRVQTGDGIVSVLSPEKRLFSPTTSLFLIWMSGSALVLFTISIVFMRNQIRPIRRLAVAADAFGKGREVRHFKLEGASEVRQAAAAFLAMRERIQRQITQRTEMLAGVSHDLRTPLTRMRLALDLLGDGPEVEELKDDVGEMEVMIEGYLAFARGEGEEAAQPTDLARLLAEAVNGARRAGADVTLAVDDALALPLRPNVMRRCLANLLGNARRHADRIWVSALRRDGAIEIAVDDDGPGIPPDRREDVFRPFFRLDRSRNRATGGSGLGLTIARDVVRGHGGDITLADSPYGGLRVIIRLPL